MRIKVLTSSRADFGIYLPLLLKMAKDKYFKIELLVFGTHLSKKHGYTIEEITQYKFKIKYKVKTVVDVDTPKEMVQSMGLTTKRFAEIWEKEKRKTDLIFCLGDRYEMHAAVLAAMPFGIKIAHFHGGETSLGSVDNVFRHSITLMSDYHFTSTENAATRVENIIGHNRNVFPVGALSLDKVVGMKLLDPDQFKKQYKIPLSNDMLLLTFHPETRGGFSNEEYADVISEALKRVKNPLLITLPNSDPEGNKIRKVFKKLGRDRNNTFVVESLGAVGYFSAMKHCGLLIGNSSSGIIEAASFGKYVINLGKRQEGREFSENTFHVPIEEEKMLTAINELVKKESYKGVNIYGDGYTSSKIIEILKGNK